MDAAEAARATTRSRSTRLAGTPVDVVTAMTLGYADEAIGIARAAAATPGSRSVISFTVETDGRLPSGMPLGEAIEATDAGDRRLPDPLHGQLRPPDPLRPRPRDGRRRGVDGSAGSGPTPRR